MSLFIIAGETSGDALGGAVLRSLPQSLKVSGIGGDEMCAAGLNSLFPMEELSIMGVVEVLPRLPSLMRRIRQTADAIIRAQPSIVLTIDSPDFCFRVVKKVRKYCPNTQFMHLVAPTVWAWREKRAEKIAKIYDRLFCLLPFEPPYFEKYGLNTHFIGHPVLSKKEGFFDVKREKNHVLVLFGSRSGEIKRLSPAFCDVMRRYAAKNPETVFFLPVFDRFKSIIVPMVEGLNVVWVDPKERYDVFAKVDRAIAASGTAGLELSLFGCPHIIGYKVNALTYALLRRHVRVPYAHLENIIANQMLVPEFLQEECAADQMIKALESIDTDMNVRQKNIIDALSPPKGFTWVEALYS